MDSWRSGRGRVAERCHQLERSHLAREGPADRILGGTNPTRKNGMVVIQCNGHGSGWHVVASCDIHLFWHMGRATMRSAFTTFGYSVRDFHEISVPVLQDSNPEDAIAIEVFIITVVFRFTNKQPYPATRW